MDTIVKEWLYNLNVIYNHIDNTLFAHASIYQHIDEITDQELLYDCDAIFITYILINANSYIDEWNIYTDKESISIREVCKPVFKFINRKWSGIKNLRNNVLAHNHRDKSGRSIHFNSNWLKHKVPMNNIEIELLVYLLGLTVEAVNNHYKFDFDSFSKTLEYQKQVYSPMNINDATQVKTDLRKDMNELIIIQNKRKE